MSLHQATHTQPEAPDFYIGSGSPTHCTAHPCRSLTGLNSHWDCFTEVQWACECSQCNDENQGNLWVEADTQYYIHDDDPEGVCSLCYTGDHHIAFMLSEFTDQNRRATTWRTSTR